jgi:nucleoside-diphosphate-sugar epimerase
MTRLLVTGANGFIGKSVLRVLAGRREYEVHAVTSRNLTSLPSIAAWHVTDLLDAAQVRELFRVVRPTHLLHLAWYTTHGDYWTSPQNARWLEASRDLLQQFHAHGGQRVVMAGSCAEYDWQAGGLSETTTPLRPPSFYGECKKELFGWLTEFSGQTGLSVAWARMFFLYGPHETPQRLVPSVIRALLGGLPARCSAGWQIRDFLYVEDVADALVCVLAGGAAGPVNVASGRPIRIRDLVLRIADQINRRDLVQLGALPDRADDPPRVVAEVAKLTGECGWTPKFDLDSGLERTIHWWRSQSSDAPL